MNLSEEYVKNNANLFKWI